MFDDASLLGRSWNIDPNFGRALLVSVWRQAYGDWLARGGRDGEDAQIGERLLLLVTHIEETAMRRMTSWFVSVRRQFGSVNGAKSRRHGSGGTRRQTPAFVESLEDRCLLAAGDLDPSFGVAGRVTTRFGTGVVATGSAIQSDGKIVVAGSVYTNNGTAFALARYNTNGTLDTSFGDTGTITTAFGATALGNSVVIQSDGKILVAGQSNDTNSDFALARYNSDGSLDTSFDGDGKVTTDFGTLFGDFANSVALQTDGKIVVAGIASGGGQSDFALARYNSDGSLDTSFDGDGKLTADFGSSNARANDVALQEDGKIVVAGESDGYFTTARFNANGSLDTSFGASGRVVRDETNGQAKRLALQSDGKIIVFGNRDSTFGVVVRYDVSGGLDATFGEDGPVITTFIRTDIVGDMTIQNDGKILIAGMGIGLNANSDFALARLHTNGTFDLTFGPNGTVLTDFGVSSDVAKGITLQTDGKIVLAGNAENKFAVARYLSGTENPTPVDQPPSINSPNAASVDENITTALTVAATDPEAHFLLYGLSGGVDQSKFSINTFSGVLSFTSAPDFESPTDGNHDNTYEVTVAASDGTNLVTQTISVSVTNANEAPSITSANSISVPENTTAVMSVAAADPEHDSLSYSLTDGADQTLFNIDPDSGAVSFKSAPNFENPTDANHDNVYSVQVQVSDGANLVTQNLNITVTNVDESPTITSASTASIAENLAFVGTVTGSDPEGHLPHFGIIGGTDQSKFTLNFLTGTLSFVSPPDFEHSTDTNHDNVYELQVAVSDGTHLVTQDISVTVTNVNETVTIPLPANGGNFKTLFLNGQLHLRSSLGKQLITPVTLLGGSDVIFNGSNVADRLTLDRSWSSFAGSLTFNGNGGNDQLDARTVSLGVTFNGGDGNDTFLGGSGDDTTNGGIGLDSLSGNDGNDSLTGGDGNDKLFGGAGGDIITGDAGTDSLSGGDDDDSLSGGDAIDTLNGDAGNDTITGDAGADIITGGDDDDLLFGNAGNDNIDGGRGDDVIDGGDDNDNLKGFDGNDAIRGGMGNDTLSGGKGDDLLTGSAGNDSLLGDDGTDTLLGDAGNDILKGGNGTDIINGVLTGLSRDTISDSTKVIDTSFMFDFDALLAGLM